ncbi:MAG: glycoside hydrolase family 3 protein [Desulfopila sp.]
MDLDQKIGRMLIVGFKGASVNSDSPILRDIRTLHLGGVILFDRLLAEKRQDNNIISARQLKTLTSDLQASARSPLLIAIDQEGGRVSRLSRQRGFAPSPPAAELGASADTGATTRAAQQTAKLLLELGINFNMAPVVDLNTYADNPIIGGYQRSFGADPDQVVRHAAAWITAHSAYGITSCLKHFPGHGSARADSHLGFVDVSEYWRDDELQPYRQLIDEKMVTAVMTGHLYNRYLDPEAPATLSRPTITGLLRNRLGFDGVVVSDDMQMQAISRHYGVKEAVCQAIRAGVDLLVFGNNLSYSPDTTREVVMAIRQGLAEGLVSEAEIDTACRRIARLLPG